MRRVIPSGRSQTATTRGSSPASTCLPSVRTHSRALGTLVGTAHYLFNLVGGEAATQPSLRERANAFLRAGMWGVEPQEGHGEALAAGDLVLVYLGAPERTFVGRAELASAVHDWTQPEAEAYPGDSSAGVLLAHVEEWNPPVPMSAVLSQIQPPGSARADFEAGVVRISAKEYATALAVAAAGVRS